MNEELKKWLCELSGLNVFKSGDHYTVSHKTSVTGDEMHHFYNNNILIISKRTFHQN